MYDTLILKSNEMSVPEESNTSNIQRGDRVPSFLGEILWGTLMID